MMRVRFDTLIRLDQSFIFKTIVVIRTNDDMVENRKFKQRANVDHPFG